MTIPSASKHKPLDPPNANVAAVDPRTGHYTMQELQRQQKVRNFVNGMGRVFPCSCAGTNELTLTPNGHGGEDGDAPLLEGYRFGDSFLFWAENNSTGNVTAKVVTKAGSNLATIKVYKTNGSAQAGNGDITANSLYLAAFHPLLDTGAGGLVLK